VNLSPTLLPLPSSLLPQHPGILPRFLWGRNSTTFGSSFLLPALVHPRPARLLTKGLERARTRDPNFHDSQSTTDSSSRWEHPRPPTTLLSLQEELLDASLLLLGSVLLLLLPPLNPSSRSLSALLVSVSAFILVNRHLISNLLSQEERRRCRWWPNRGSALDASE